MDKVSPEERYGTIKSPDYPILAKGAELFRDVERRVKGSPAEFLLPGGGIAQVLDRYAYGEDPSGMEYAMAGFDVADATPMGKVLAGVLPAGKKMADYLERGFIGIDTKRVDPGEIDRFDPDIGQGSRRDTGTFVSLSTDQAATYAPKVGGAIMPVRVDANDFPEVDFHGTGWNDPNGKRTLLDPETQEEIADLSGMDTNQIARHVREMGFPGVRMLDVVDPGPHRTGLSEGAFEEYFRTGDTQLVVFDPDRIVFEKQSTPVKKADGGAVEALQKQKLREAAFDNEFGIEVAAQSNYAVDIDPSVARYHGLEGVSGDRRMTLGGFTVPPEDPEDPYTSYDLRPYEFRDPETNRRYAVPVEPNTVNAVHSLATPEVWAHEYRHRQYPNMSEFQNRLIDAATAQNERQWNEAVRMWQDQLYRDELRRNEDAQRMPLSEAEEDLLGKLLSRDRQRYYLNPIFKDEYERGARLPPPEGFLTRLFSTDKGEYVDSRLQNAYFMKRAQELENLREYNEDLPEQNRDRAKEAAVRNYANGGGIAALAPRATGMFNGPQINKGVGAYAPLTRRRA